MKPKHRRLTLVLVSLAVLGSAAVLALRALDTNLVYFLSPSMIAESPPSADQRFRVGGLVEPGSVHRPAGDITEFRVTDQRHAVAVRYHGVLPDLFREGQGVVAEGTLDGEGVFIAREVLAKHDENYMPPEVAEALKKAGRWKEGEAP